MKCDFERTLSDGKTGFAEFMEVIEGHLESRDVPVDVVMKFMIAFDEVISNVINHGSLGGNPQITVRLAQDENRVTAEVEDNGVAFDPLSLATPDTSLSVEDRAIGGLGIHLVRELMDSVDYLREGEFNRLRFAKTFLVG